MAVRATDWACKGRGVCALDAAQNVQCLVGSSWSFAMVAHTAASSWNRSQAQRVQRRVVYIVMSGGGSVGTDDSV